jgi:hypothetical protein
VRHPGDALQPIGIVEKVSTTLDYNACRPLTSLGGLTPNEFAARSERDHKQNGFWL